MRTLAAITCTLGLVLTACGPMPDDDGTPTPLPTSALHDGHTAVGDAGLLKLTWHCENDAPVLGTNTFTLDLSTIAGDSLDGADVTFDLFMPMHGHGSSARPVIADTGGGRYVVTNVVFQMAGEWHLTVHARRGTLDDAATFVLDVQ